MKIKELFTDESKWTQAASARDKNYNKVDPESSEAVCWCLIGGLVKCYPPSEIPAIELRIECYLRFLGHHYYCYIDWQDACSRIFEDIKKLVEELDI